MPDDLIGLFFFSSWLLISVIQFHTTAAVGEQLLCMSTVWNVQSTAYVEFFHLVAGRLIIIMQ